MAASLEDLLADEGFRGRKPMTTPRTSMGSRTISMPVYSWREQQKKDSVSVTEIKTDGRRSDVTRYSLRGEFPRSDSVRVARPRDNLVRRGNMDGRSKQENMGRYDARGSKSVHEGRKYSHSSIDNFPGNEIVEIRMEGTDRFKDIYSNDVYSPDIGTSGFFNRVDGKEEYKERLGEDIKLEKKKSSIYREHLLRRAQTSHRSDRVSSNGTSFEENQHKRSDVVLQAISELALDDVAIQAVVSIINSSVEQFVKYEDFRITLRSSCFSSLNIVELEEGQGTDRKVIMNLEQAIETVEKSSEGIASAKDLKRASLQLSMITGLNSNDLKDGSTSGIPNSRLSACAHLYLSVVYKLQKKDRISAKHLLQVFADSPFQARTTLLPELWDYLFFPHLSHLEVWYNQEIESLEDTQSKRRKLNYLEKVYNELLDSGTYQFAVYYKVWLTKGVEAPSVPSICTPSISVLGIQHDGLLSYSSELASPGGTSSPMVSKKLYDAVFFLSNKRGVYDGEDDGEAGSFDNYMRSSDNYMRSSGGSSVEVKHTLTYSSEMHKHTDIDVKEDISKKGSIVPTHDEENELALKKLTKSIFKLEETRGLVDDSKICFSSSDQAMNYSPADLVKRSFCSAEFDQSYREGFVFLSTPQDFICPLTGQLFEDPVTLETGQTFERVAISKWFNQGNRTCPVTGVILDKIAVPHTNFVLKRIIDSWKPDHSSNYLDLSSKTIGNSGGYRFTDWDDSTIFLLEKLLNSFSKEERVAQVKNFISVGGLQYISQRFETGNLVQKTHLSALLLHFIEEVSDCRNQITQTINIRHLLELLHCEEIKSRTNAVLLLTELLCINREKDVILLSGLQNEGIKNTMHVVLLYLQSSPPEKRPMAAVLLLHLDLLVEHRKSSIYREEAIDALSDALSCGLTNEKVQKECIRALLILARNFCSHESKEDEEHANEEWLRNMSESMLGNGKRSFIWAVSKCLGSRNSDLVRVCLITMAWLSCALSTQSDTKFQLSAFSALIAQLNDCLEHSEQVEHRILASMSLLNFSKIPECGVLLMTTTEEITSSLQSLAEVTGMGKQLCALLSEKDLL